MWGLIASSTPIIVGRIILRNIYTKALLHSHIHVHAEIDIYIYIYWIHTDAMINRHTQWTRHRKSSLTKCLLLTLFVRVRKGLIKGLHVRGSWRPNITEIFWPQSYGRQRCVFLILHGCSTGAMESTLLGAGFPYYISSISVSSTTRLSLTQLNCLLFNLSALYYLQTPTRWYGHASATSSDIWRPGCVTSAIFGMACVIVIKWK